MALSVARRAKSNGPFLDDSLRSLMAFGRKVGEASAFYGPHVREASGSNGPERAQRVERARISAGRHSSNIMVLHAPTTIRSIIPRLYYKPGATVG